MDCYLLVGGLSQRMGRSKPNLPFGGSTFLDRAVAAARSAFDDVITVQHATGPALLAAPTIFEEPHPDRAPLFGVKRALEEAAVRAVPNSDRADDSSVAAKCFILAVDYPLLTGELLAYLAGLFVASDALMLAPRWGGKTQMLCAGYSTALLPRVTERIDRGDYKIRGLIGQREAQIIEELELRARFAGEPLLNVNTPQDLEEAMSHDKSKLFSLR